MNQARLKVLKARDDMITVRNQLFHFTCATKCCHKLSAHLKVTGMEFNWKWTIISKRCIMTLNDYFNLALFLTDCDSVLTNNRFIIISIYLSICARFPPPGITAHAVLNKKCT